MDKFDSDTLLAVKVTGDGSKITIEKVPTTNGRVYIDTSTSSVAADGGSLTIKVTYGGATTTISMTLPSSLSTPMTVSLNQAAEVSAGTNGYSFAGSVHTASQAGKDGASSVSVTAPIRAGNVKMDNTVKDSDSKAAFVDTNGTYTLAGWTKTNTTSDTILFQPGTQTIEDVILKAGTSNKATVTLFAIYTQNPFEVKVADASAATTFGTTATIKVSGTTVATAEVTPQVAATGMGLLKITAASTIPAGDVYTYTLAFKDKQSGTLKENTDYTLTTLANGLYKIENLKQNTYIVVTATKQASGTATSAAFYVDTGLSATAANLSLDLTGITPTKNSYLTMKGTVYKAADDGIRTYASLDSVKATSDITTWKAYVDLKADTTAGRLAEGKLTLASDTLNAGTVYDLNLAVSTYSIYAVQGTSTASQSKAESIV